jgi:hemolysin D
MKLARLDALWKNPDKDSGERAFLPAALEIVETPPSPIGRAIIVTIIGAFAIAIAWACIGTVDIVAIAPGKIIPSGRTKVIQPFETGVVRAIHVRDGQSVQAGEVLVELDSTMTGAELGHYRSDLLGARLDAARLSAALTNRADPLSAFRPPAEAPADQVELQRRYLVSQTTEQNTKIAEFDRQIAQKQAERATVDASIHKLEATIPLLSERVEVRKHLVSKELGSKLLYLSELQDLVGQREDVQVQKSKLLEVDAAIAAIAEARSKAIAEFERGLFDDLAKAEQKAGGLAQDVIRAEQRTRLQQLAAPIDGVVQQLAVHTINGVVTPAQTLMVIVPIESHLEIEAMISNRDIGFIEVGQEAAVKVDTFTFTRYGLLRGKVLTVSHDAITREKPVSGNPDRGPGKESGSSEPTGQELIYAARVSLDRSRMQVGDRFVDLSPGMAVTTEIKTDSRTIMSYLISPLVRYGHDSLRER